MDGDYDGDGLNNMNERERGTSPTVADTDGDGFSDGEEVAAGSNPLESNSVPLPLSAFLSIDPSSGVAPVSGVDLRGSAVGGGAGTINYTFYCNRSDSGTNITPGWAAKFDGVSADAQVAVDACTYTEAGMYTANEISVPVTFERITD